MEINVDLCVFNSDVALCDDKLQFKYKYMNLKVTQGVLSNVGQTLSPHNTSSLKQ